MRISQRSDRFLERAGFVQARIGPRPQFDPSQNLTHLVPLAPHQISSRELCTLDGEEPPDGGRSRPIPYSPFETP